jgi:uncharacterized protein (DUF433 family)
VERTTPQTANPPDDPTTAPAAARIVRTPGTCSGKPRIDGTRIKVEQVVLWHDRMGLTPAEIVERWPHLSFADIAAALAYYRDHRDEIDADLADGDKRYEALKATQPSILDEIRRRTADAPDDQVPPR